MTTIWKEGFTQRYLIRWGSKDMSSVVATIPRAIVERAARRKGLTLSDFVTQHEIEYAYDSIEEEFRARFVEKEKPDAPAPKSVNAVSVDS